MERKLYANKETQAPSLNTKMYDKTILWYYQVNKTADFKPVSNAFTLR